MFLLRIEGKFLLTYLRWVIPWRFLLLAGRIGYCIGSSFTLELFLEDVRFVLFKY